MCIKVKLDPDSGHAPNNKSQSPLGGDELENVWQLGSLAAHVKPVRKMNRLTIDKRESLTSSRPPLLHHPLGGKLNLGGKAEVSREKQGGQADSICIFRVSNGRTSLHLADGSRWVFGWAFAFGRRSRFWDGGLGEWGLGFRVNGIRCLNDISLVRFLSFFQQNCWEIAVPT